MDLEELPLEGGAAFPFVELVDDSAPVATVGRDPRRREVATVRGQEVGGVGALEEVLDQASPDVCRAGRRWPKGRARCARARCGAR